MVVYVSPEMATVTTIVFRRYWNLFRLMIQNSLFTRHIIVNMQYKFSQNFVLSYNKNSWHPRHYSDFIRSFSYRINIVITLNYISAYLSSIDFSEFNTSACFITHEVAKVSFSCFYRSSPIINKFLLLKMTFFF